MRSNRKPKETRLSGWSDPAEERGYYLINDVEDRNKTAAVMRSQAYQMLRVARSIEQCNLEDVEQMEMI